MTELHRSTIEQPCGICLCCKAGTRCARVLRLDGADAAALAKVNRVAGDGGGRTITLRSEQSKIDRARREAPEPTVTLECPSCGDDMELFAYVAKTLKARGVAAPPCESCRVSGPQRADLR